VDFRFADRHLEALYWDNNTRGLPTGIADSFFDLMSVIVAANDESDLRALRSRRYEKLRGKRSHQHSLRLNKQYRLIVEREKGKAGITLVLMGIEDYH
jgi:proteic killer suppression protein